MLAHAHKHAHVQQMPLRLRRKSVPYCARALGQRPGITFSLHAQPTVSPFQLLLLAADNAVPPSPPLTPAQTPLHALVRSRSASVSYLCIRSTPLLEDTACSTGRSVVEEVQTDFDHAHSPPPPAKRLRRNRTYTDSTVDTRSNSKKTRLATKPAELSSSTSSTLDVVPPVTSYIQPMREQQVLLMCDACKNPFAKTINVAVDESRLEHSPQQQATPTTTPFASPLYATSTRRRLRMPSGSSWISANYSTIPKSFSSDTASSALSPLTNTTSTTPLSPSSNVFSSSLGNVNTTTTPSPTLCHVCQDLYNRHGFRCTACWAIPAENEIAAASVRSSTGRLKKASSFADTPLPLRYAACDRCFGGTWTCDKLGAVVEEDQQQDDKSDVNFLNNHVTPTKLSTGNESEHAYDGDSSSDDL